MTIALCYRVLGDQGLAEDAVQEATLLAMLNLESLRRPDSFGAWLAGISLNVCHRWLRDRSHEVWSLEAVSGGLVIDSLHATDEPGPEEALEAADLRRLVRRAVATLPAGQKTAVVLFYLSGLTHKEIATLLGIRIGTVKTRLHKGRAALRERLRHLWEEDAMGDQWEQGQFATMRVVDVRRAKAEEGRPRRHVIVLEEIGGPRRLPIWIGPSEATSIALRLEHAELPRPGSYQFCANVLNAAGGRLREVRVSKIVERTFYAEAVVEGPSGTKTVDARPSDVINLALLTDAPIKVNASVMQTLTEDLSWQDYPDGPRDLVAEVQATMRP